MANHVSQDGLTPRMKAVDRRYLLRPMAPSEVVDTGLAIYRRIARHVLLPALAPMAFCAAAILFVRAFVLPGLFLTTQGSSIGSQLAEVFAALCFAILVGGPLFVIGLAYASGPVIRLASQAMRGDPLDPGEAHAIGLQSAGTVASTMFGAILRTLWAPVVAFALFATSAIVDAMGGRESALYLWSAALGFIGIAVALIAVPLMLHQTILAPAVALLENKKPIEAIRRSGSLMGATSKMLHRPIGTTLTLLVMVLIGWVAIDGGLSLLFTSFSIPSIIASAAPLGVWRSLLTGLAESLPTFLSVWLLCPLWGATATVLYYDRRVRLEAYDIETLAGDVLSADRQTAFLN